MEWKKLLYQRSYGGVIPFSLLLFKKTLRRRSEVWEPFSMLRFFFCTENFCSWIESG